MHAGAAQTAIVNLFETPQHPQTRCPVRQAGRGPANMAGGKVRTSLQTERMYTPWLYVRRPSCMYVLPVAETEGLPAVDCTSSNNEQPRTVNLM